MDISRLVIVNGTEIDETSDTTWSLWTNTNNRVELLRHHGSFRALINNLDSRWSSFIIHRYVTRQQSDHVKVIK